MCFNPRTREGCDVTRILHLHDKDVSIHAPVRGATDKSRLVAIIIYVSIHAPVRGATVIIITIFL